METKATILDRGALAQAVVQAVSGGGSFVLTVTGGSMVPALLHKKSQVELSAPEDVRLRDIVLARRQDGSLVLHRVIAIDGDILTLCGDAQSWTEEVLRSQLLAKVTRICRSGRWRKTGGGQAAYARCWGLTRPIRPAMFRLYSKIQRKRR